MSATALSDALRVRLAKGGATTSGSEAVGARTGLLGAVAAAVGVVVVAALLRMIGIRTSNDIFIDEVTYVRLARSIADGHGVALSGVPFDLHPPAVLGIYGAFTALIGPQTTIVQLIFDLRFVAAGFGALTCLGLYLLVRQGASGILGTAAAIVLALDPFAILFDSRVLLEAPTQAAAVATVAVLAAAIGATRRRRRNFVLLAGLLAAVTVCSKETFGLALMIGLLFLMSTGWALRRREIATVIGMAGVGYLINVVILGLASGFSPWWNAQTSGVRRLIGIDQETGFNAPTTHVSLLSRAFANAGTEASSYLLLIMGGAAAGAILWSAWRRRNAADRGVRERVAILVAGWTAGGAVYLCYATLFGTIEEQMYYICLLPCIASISLFIAGLSSRSKASFRGTLRTTAVVALAAILVFDGSVWARSHSAPDDDYSRLVAWQRHGIPVGSVVATTETTAQFLLSGVVIGQWHTWAAFRQHHVQYVVVSTALADQGYGLAQPSLIKSLERRAPVVFTAHDATTGSLEVFDIRGLDR